MNDTPLRLDDAAVHSEKRDSQRVSVNQEFACIDEYISEYVSSISLDGVFIRSKNPLPVGTRVSLEFSVIVDDIETVEGEGEVVRVERDCEYPGMGVAFTRLTAQSKELIDRVIERHAPDTRRTGRDG